MEIFQSTIELSTENRGTYLITEDINKVIRKSAFEKGLCHLFIQHTSASLIICENYDSQVRRDLENFLSRLVPDGDPLFKHTIEGEDDMPAHIRSILTQTSLTIPIQAKQLALGTWQGVYVYEHRYIAQNRKIFITLMGESKRKNTN